MHCTSKKKANKFIVVDDDGIQRCSMIVVVVVYLFSKEDIAEFTHCSIVAQHIGRHSQDKRWRAAAGKEEMPKAQTRERGGDD
jgi:hypothetical protein